MADMSFMQDEPLAEPSSDIGPVPAGTYDVEIIESDVRRTKDGSGVLLALTMKIVSGPLENRRIWSNINLKNKSAEAERIGLSQASDLCRAVGFERMPGDSTDFHGIPFQVRVIVKSDPNYGDKNEVKGYKAATGAPPAQQQARPAPPQRASAAPASGGRPAPAFMQRRQGG